MSELAEMAAERAAAGAILDVTLRDAGIPSAGDAGSHWHQQAAQQAHAAFPLIAAAVLRDVAAELDELGLCQAGRVVLRLADKHEAAE
jgi:hypothetical protein